MSELPGEVLGTGGPFGFVVVSVCGGWESEGCL